MKLLAKFNLFLVLIFGLGILLIARNAYSFLTRETRAEVLQQARLMGASASATMDYTGAEVSPILERTPQHRDAFLPQTIPFYAATAAFQNIRKQYPDYTLREAALNPMNLNDRATDWENDIIVHFRDHPEQTQIVGERDTPTGRSLYIAEPVIASGGCLQCHSTHTVAPKALVKRYGQQNGFGWRSNEIVAAQIVSVPMSVPVRMARDGFRNLILSLSVIFLATIVLIDLAMFLLVIRPLRRVSMAADRISKGDMHLPQLEVKGKDEIAQVTASFNRMHTSLLKAFELLNG